MLTQIHIRDFAIIDQLELELEQGLTVLTGETGAGKSILIDALGLVLGDRATAEAVRHGAKRAEISASFRIGQLPRVQAWLSENELDDDEEVCILRRVIAASGGSKGYINGRPAPLQLLKTVGEMLVDIHGQHQHQSLLKADVQRRALDEFGGQTALADEIGRLHYDWRSCRHQLDELRQAARDRDARLELLRYHIDELERLALQPDEVSALEEEHKRLANGEKILQQCHSALLALSEGEERDALSTLDNQLAELEKLRDSDSQIANVCDMLQQAAIQIREGCDELRHYVDHFDLDPARLAEVEQRLDAIYDLARKHHIDPAQLPALLDELSRELAQLERADTQLGELEERLAALEKSYGEKAAKLTKQRQRAATKLAKAVTATLRELGMPHGQFQISLAPRDDNSPHPHGLESIIFEVTTNPGQPPRALAKVASGGELSRIALAIQVLLSSSQQIPTLIFDEVDTGIGGAVAETVGRQLRKLGESHQVLCVTHLAQVAALGHHHLHVSKESDKRQTRTRIETLSRPQRREEIARMLGGVELTAQSRAHAEEMLERVEKT